MKTHQFIAAPPAPAHLHHPFLHNHLHPPFPFTITAFKANIANTTLASSDSILLHPSLLHHHHLRHLLITHIHSGCRRLLLHPFLVALRFPLFTAAGIAVAVSSSASVAVIFVHCRTALVEGAAVAVVASSRLVAFQYIAVVRHSVVATAGSRRFASGCIAVTELRCSSGCFEEVLFCLQF